MRTGHLLANFTPEARNWLMQQYQQRLTIININRVACFDHIDDEVTLEILARVGRGGTPRLSCGSAIYENSNGHLGL
jgi:hypothetical protein